MTGGKKNILVGICGGIAAYKMCDLVRMLTKNGFSVDVIMTRNAAQFVTPLSLQTLTGNPVYSELFTLIQQSEIGHISLADRADAVVIAPATANVIGKIAGGIADDLLTTTVMAVKAPVLIVPSMNRNMWENPIVQENIGRLEKYYSVMQPAEGLLACGVYGSGKLPDVEDIYEELMSLMSDKPLAGRSVLVTAGPTREEIDPVRYVSNYSSGKMGYAVATVARRLGADVTLVSGPSSLRPPYGVKLVNVASAGEMLSACRKTVGNADILVMTAAVADFRPAKRAPQKVKKKAGQNSMSLEMTKNPDILKQLGALKKKGAVFVGFAAETEKADDNGRRKLKEKDLDIIVVNNVLEKGSGFGTDTNKVTIIDRKKANPLPLMTKLEVARHIFKHAADYSGKRGL